MVTSVSDATRPRLRVRRSPVWLAAGLVAICLGGLGSAFVFSALTASTPALQATRTIYRGEVIQPSDLAAIPVGSGLEASVVSEHRLDEVVGRAAVVDVPNGSLLVDGTWGEAGLQPGWSRVGVRLPVGRFPAGDLIPGTPLLAVGLPVANALGEEAVPISAAATLVSAPAQQADGSFAFALDVAAADAESVARLAADDRVALVQIASRR